MATAAPSGAGDAAEASSIPKLSHYSENVGLTTLIPHEWQWLCMSDIAHHHTHSSLVHVHTQKLRDRFMKAARKQCNKPILTYLKCRNDEGLLCVVKCRPQWRDVNDCLHPLTTEEKFAAYKAQFFRDNPEALKRAQARASAAPTTTPGSK